MNEIEGLDFSAEMNLAAGRKAFARNMREHPLFARLLESVKADEGRTVFSRRVRDLAEKPIDLAYEHPADVAFSAYLMALSDAADPQIVSEAAGAVARARNCSWSFEISRNLMTKSIAKGSMTGRVTMPRSVLEAVAPGLSLESIAAVLDEVFRKKTAPEPSKPVQDLLSQSIPTGEIRNIASGSPPVVSIESYRKRDRKHRPRSHGRTANVRKYASAQA